MTTNEARKLTLETLRDRRDPMVSLVDEAHELATGAFCGPVDRADLLKVAAIMEERIAALDAQIAQAGEAQS